jgi:tRNA G18 (ribose-2'-O)-methylase SpoU
MTFSKKKFVSLSVSKQKKELHNLLRLIENKFNDLEVRKQQINNFNIYIEYLKKNNDVFLGTLNKISENISLRGIYENIMTLNNEMSINEKDIDFMVETCDREVVHKKKESELVVILDNLRSAFNVGSIFRTSECVGIKRIYLTGYTPNPDNKKVRDTSMGTYQYVDWGKIETSEEEIARLKKDGYTIYCFETVDIAENLYDMEFVEKSCFVFGNEAFGIPKDILKNSDYIVKIPVFGWKNSLNVGVAFSVGIYEYLRQIIIKKSGEKF